MERYILMVFSFLVCGFAIGQENNGWFSTEIEFGIKAGLNSSNFIGEESSKSVVGFQSGFVGELKFNNKIALQPELLYSVQGAKLELGEAVKLHYFEVPIIGKYYISNIFCLEAGPYIGFLLAAKQAGQDVRDLYKTTDFGFDFGGSLTLTDDISVGLRYGLGLVGLKEVPATQIKNPKNAVYQFNLLYKIF